MIAPVSAPGRMERDEGVSAAPRRDVLAGAPWARYLRRRPGLGHIFGLRGLRDR
ncbi:Hypothetical protein A7982_08173 [Minicystis rosea]|nr:Hypothetical protein A7982_08173 [Minicystis rosea]